MCCDVRCYLQVDPATRVPTLLYTGVRLRNNPRVKLPAPPCEYDPGLRHIETQCAAICDPGVLQLGHSWYQVPLIDTPQKRL